MPLNYSRWKHRITYSLSPVTTVADRWVSLVLPWRVGINSDYSDIRFTDTAGNSLNYNIASKTDWVTATLKIEIPTTGTRLIHLYFGNSQATSESTAAGTEDTNPVLTAVSGTTNPAYSGVWTRQQGGRLNQQKYTSSTASGPYPEWKYKALIQITNPVSQTNYQHKLTLAWHPGMRSDFRDIRFAQLNGKKCDYWVESYVARTSAVVWIEVPTAGQKWLNLYYGNGRVASESNGNNTFLLFDDFTDGIVSDKWVQNNLATCSESGGHLNIIGDVSTYNDFTTGIRLALELNGSFSAEVTLDYNTNSSSMGQGLLILNSGTNNIFAGIVDAWNTSTGAFHGVIETSNYNSGFDSRTSGKIQVKITRDELNDVKIFENGLQRLTNNTNLTYSSIGLTNTRYQTYPPITTYYTNLIVRKFTTTEPSLTVISHQPNTDRILSYETLGDQPSGGNTYIMDPIETNLTLSGSIGSTVLQPLISSGLMLQPSISGLTWSALIEAELSLSGNVLTKNYIPLDTLDITQFSVSKAVSDDIWAMNTTIDGYTELNTDVLRHATFSTTDHLGVSQSIFAGILPKGSYTIKDAANKTVISGYDYAWYLSRQQVQAEYRHNTAGTNPATVITGLLGGDDWEETTGIMPYKINPVTAWGDTLNSKVFDFAIGTTKKQAIEKICAYCRFVFLVKWIVVEGIATAAAYFISEDDIDTELDLPAPVTFTYPDPYLADSIKPVVRGDERYNRVTVIGRNNAGGVFFSTVESPSVTAGDELAIEKIENSGSWTTQAQVDARAAELYSYYSATAYTYTAKLLDRMDLELLQKMRITGYTGVSENWMRITRIKKTVRATKDGVEKLVEIEFTEDTKWSALRRMYRYSSDDMTSEIETIVDNKIGQIPGMQVGICTEIDGPDGTVVLESGETITTRVV